MKVRIITSLVFVVLLMASKLHASEIHKELDKLMQGFADIKQFNGTVLVSKGDDIIFEKAYGYANFEWDIKNTIDTKYRIASVTKPFTAMLIMQLVQEGKIKLDAPITQYLKDYRKDTGDKITIHHLLNHTSGIPDFLRLREIREISGKNPYSVGEFVTKFCSEDLDFSPGTQWRYSNSGYTILGHIMEAITGKTYAELLQNRIFTPLEMKNSGYDFHHTVKKKKASGYEKTFKGFEHAEFHDMDIPYAAGAIYSTTHDLMRWERALSSEKLLKKSLMDKMYQTSPHRNYSYGWFIDDIPTEKYGRQLTNISHAGMIQGFNSYVSRYIEDQYLIVILNNTGGAPMRSMTAGITNILYGKPYAKAKPRIYTDLYNIISTEGLDAGISKYHALNKEGIKLGERGLNYFGYELLKVDMIKEAIAFFKLAVELVPNSSNVHDSLGEAYLKNDDKKMALHHYKRSFELDQSNSNAQKAIMKLEVN